jgi:recombination protein RecA
LAQLKKGDQIIGNRVRAKIVKNKVAAPFKSCEFDIMYNEGISWTGDLIDAGLTFGVLTKTGNTLLFKEAKLGVGREQAKEFLKANLEVSQSIREAVWEAVKKMEGE